MDTRQPIHGSSNIAAVGYDPQSATLEVEFKKGGAVYQYIGVPLEVYQKFMAAESKGKFFHGNIVNAGYRTTRVK